MFAIKIASVLIFLSNILLLMIIPFTIIRDQRFYNPQWLYELLRNIETDLLFLALRIDLIGFAILGVAFYQLWAASKSESRMLIAAISLWLWVPVRYYFQLIISNRHNLTDEQIPIVPVFLISTLLLSISGISRINRWYDAFIIINLLSVSLMLISPLAGFIFKGGVVPFFAINAAITLYTLDAARRDDKLDYWKYFEKTRI